MPQPAASIAASAHLLPLHAGAQGVWDLRWADDSAELLAIIERDTLYILRSGRPEEPVPTAARLCAFADLQVTVPALPVQHTLGAP